MLDVLRQPESLSLDKIRTDGGTQPRAGLNEDVAQEYADAINGPNAWPFPPVVVFFDGDNYWLADGFHRIEAARRYCHREKLAPISIPCDIRQGSQRDAILYSVGANAEHGLRRTNADKRRAVLRLLQDAEWSQWSNREIARRCKVDEKTVRNLRNELTADNPQLDTASRTYTTRHGTVATMNTANIGVRPEPTESNENAVPTITVPEDPRQLRPDWFDHYAADGWKLIRSWDKLQAVHFGRELATKPYPTGYELARAMAAREWSADYFWLDGQEPEAEDGHTAAAPVHTERLPVHIRPSALQRAAEAITGEPADENGYTVPSAAKRLAPLMTSSTGEHYTPSEIIDAVVKTIGPIDLDPCSPVNGPTVPAAQHYTVEDDGLAQFWRGTVYMNPPYGAGIDAWVAKLIESYRAGDVTAAVALLPARTDTRWWQQIRDYPVCFVTGRIRFEGAGNGAPAPFPSALVYLGADLPRFIQATKDLGDVWRRIDG